MMVSLIFAQAIGLTALTFVLERKEGGRVSILFDFHEFLHFSS